MSAKNAGDVIYSYRFHRPLPEEIIDTKPPGLQWIIELAGRGIYRFSLEQENRIVPNLNLVKIKLPNSTPEIVEKYSSGDEQALLTKIRYNRLIDIFLGITAYSLQNHLRTTVREIGQIEIDEVYVGLNHYGTHFIVPVQAKTGNDQISIVQTKQDIAYCREKFPDLICRPVSAQFISLDTIAIFELILDDSGIRIVEEKHYQLVTADAISQTDLRNYNIF
ncbi:MAG: endonuclease [Microcoleaceae cyanobacterium]